MKRITILISFVFALLALSGCESKKALVGTWRAETTVVEKQTFGNDRVSAIVLILALPEKGDATYQHFVNSEKIDEAIGGWKKADDYLIIKRSNEGFAAFRITSLSHDRIAIVVRDGKVYQFNRTQ